MNLNSIQYVRAIAALLVVFYHGTVYVSRMFGDTALFDTFGGFPGSLGVVAFFVISGYLMADISPKYSASTFLTHRVIRIYPAYLFCVILAGIYFAVLWQALRPDAGFIPNFKSMLLTGADPLALLRLTLVPIVFNDYPLGIEWTLLYETTFYVIIFAVSLVGAIKYLLPLALGWLALLMVVTMFYPLTQIGYTSPSLLTVLLFGINSAFIFGIVGRHIQHWVRPYPAFLLGVLLLAPMGAFPHPYTTIQLCAGTASLVLGLIALDRDGRLPEMPLLRALGGWSYALYLIHVPVTIGLFKVMEAPTAVLIASALVGSVLVSSLLGWLDLTAYQFLKRGTARHKVIHKVLAGSFVAIFLAAGIIGLRLQG